MIDTLERYIDPEFVYSFTQGPEQVRDELTARKEGLNCVALAHLALKELFGHSLPPSLHCYEMFSDTARFTTVQTPAEMQTGDLVWFGHSTPKIPIEKYTPHYDETGALTNWRTNPVKHVAIFTGDMNNDDPLMLHATHTEGTNVVWPLQEFALHKRYERIYRISRFVLATSDDLIQTQKTA